MRFDNQLRYALQIIDTYRGATPLHVYLKDFFRANKQMGARDRKLLSALTYSFYRLGHAARHLPVDQRLLTGLFLCNDQPNDLLKYFRPDWDPTAPLAKKIAATDLRLAEIFPWEDELSPSIDHEAFCLSFLRQPDLFLRIRPGHEQTARDRLSGVGEFIPPSTYRLPNSFNVKDHFIPDREIVIQDYSSQQVGHFFKPPTTYLLVSKEPRSFWDTCAGSGGKSILAHDLYPEMDITVSDIRESILHNLRARFRTAGIKKYQSFLIDLSTQSPPAAAANAGLILADTPCTGSGTWSRTPEQLYFFQPQQIPHYSTLQKKILEHIAPHLAPDATLVYCTCSVFKKENEEIAAFLREKYNLRQIRMENITGYNERADTLFAARFTR